VSLLKIYNLFKVNHILSNLFKVTISRTIYFIIYPQYKKLNKIRGYILILPREDVPIADPKGCKTSWVYLLNTYEYAQYVYKHLVSLERKKHDWKV